LPYDITTNSMLSITFEGRHEGQQVMNTMNYVYDGGATTEDGPSVVDEVDDLITAANELWDKWLACISFEVIDCVRYYQWFHPIRYAWIGKGLDVDTTGAFVGPALPPNASQVVTRRTDFAGREETSTLKLPGVPAERVGGGIIVPAHVVDLGIFAAKSVNVITLLSGSKLVPVPWNRTSPGSANQLRTSYAHNTVRTMHRRTVGLGT